MGMENIFYFCTVKTHEQQNAVTLCSVFCALTLETNNRIEWVNGNVPEAPACECLTARNAVSFLTSKNLQV